MRSLVALSSALTLLPAIAAAAPRVTLVKEGRPAAAIVLAREPTKAAQIAAFELQYHVKRITGAELPIVTDGAPVSGTRVLVGESDATRAMGLTGAGLGLQEYVIRARGGALVLMGRDADDRAKVLYGPTPDNAMVATWPGFWDEQATLYAVYDFLERCCGVRWYNPTEAGLVCPQTKTLAVSVPDVRRAPAMRYRNACYQDSSRYERYTALQPQDDTMWSEYEAAAYPELKARVPDAGRFTQARRGLVQLFRLRMREGGENCPGNHSLYGYYARFWEKDPKHPEQFEAKHADWFAQGYEGTPPQMCYTNPGLAAQVAQDARDFFDGKGAKPGAQAAGNFFCVEPMDNSSFCKCPRCQAAIAQSRREEPKGVYSSALYSDYFFSFVNAVAREVRKTHPDKWIVCLAYSTHAYPPTFKLEPNVAVQFCFASNRMPYARQGYENDLKALALWGAQSKERPMYLWLYDTFPVEIAVNGRFHAFPGAFAHTIGEQFRRFHQLGYRGVFHCGYGQEVEAYLTYKLMDDPSLRVDKLLDEYFERYYGPAGAPLKRMYLDMESAYCDPRNYPGRPGHQNVGIAWGRLGTAERMARYARWVDEAKKLARTDEERRRVAIFDLLTWRYMQAGRQQYVARTESPIPSVAAPRVQAAGGDPAKADWSKAAPMPGPWHARGGDAPAARALSGRMMHDGEYLYLELTDPCDPKKLQVSAQVFPCDTWELFVARERAIPYRHFAVGPSGSAVAMTNGEVNWRMNVPLLNPGIRAASDTTAPDRWVTRLAIPLSELAAGGIAPGGTFHLNVVRVTNGALAGDGRFGIDSWVSYCTVHDVDRLAEIRLE